MALVQLPGGAQVELHDKLTVWGRRVLAPAFADMIHALVDRFPNLGDFSKVDLTDEQLAVKMLGNADGAFVAASMDFQAAAIVAFVKSWTLGANPTMDTVYHCMDEDAFDALAKAVAPLAIGAMRRTEWGPAGAKDPASPTGPSSASNGGWRAEDSPTTHSTPSTLVQPSGSGSTDSVGSFT